MVIFETTLILFPFQFYSNNDQKVNRNTFRIHKLAMQIFHATMNERFDFYFFR